MTLSSDERVAFERDGYFIRRGALPDSLVDALNQQLSALIERCAKEHIAGTRRSMSFWDILLSSRDDASVLWESSNASMPASPSDWEKFVMRVGHGLHRVDPLYRDVIYGDAIGLTLRELVPPPASLVTSAVVYKQPQSDSVQFGLHQDAAYIVTEPETLVLAFVALDDMDADNGALAVVPGSHKSERFVTLGMGRDGFVRIAGSEPAERDHKQVLLPMTRGTVTYVHGRTLHASGPNRSPRPRRSLIVHAISGSAKLAPETWVQPPPGGFETIEPSASSKT